MISPLNKERSMDKNIMGPLRGAQDGISRRQFLQFCSTVAAAIGLDPIMGSKVAAALSSASRPPVLWLHFAECTACTEAVLRTTSPFIDDLILETVSIDYHETLMAASGSTVHDLLSASAEKYQGQFVCVVEGAIPTADNGNFGTVNGKTMLSIAREICPKAKCIICIGNCSSFGGLPAAAPNLSGAKNVIAALKDITVPPVINVPGCPPNPVSFVGVIANYLLKGVLPGTDEYLRPLFAYGKTVHNQCPFIKDTGPTGRCLKTKGCKGPITNNSCPTIKFNNAVNFPTNAGHVCIGCSEPKFWDQHTPFWGLLADQTDFPPTPAELFEKTVQPIPVSTRRTPFVKERQPENPQVYDLLGRRISSAKLNKNRGVGRKPIASGMHIEKSEGVRKTLHY
jgi:[NiFe] hydrogenase small subunit